MTAANFTNYCDSFTDDTTPNECNSFSLTNTAIVTSSTTAVISAISSLAILYIISKSQQKWRSIYHRIMSNIAIFDFMSSIAIALNTIPMPRDTIYPFSGRRMYGTAETCEAQAFVFILGFVGSYYMFCGLMWYYACLIQLKISDRKLRRYLEPTIYAIAWLTPLISCPFLVANDLYNPTPLESWCRQSPYPFDCLLDDQEEKSCIRGSPDVASSTQIAIIIFPIVGVVTIIVCMSMIICGSWRINSFFIEETPEDQDQQQQQQQSQNVPSQAQLLNAEWKTMKRSLVRQASMYLSAFILTWLFVIPHRVLASDNVFANFLFCIFFPLSGFYNFSIFIFHKIIIIRKNYPDTTFRNAFIGVFSRTDEVPDARISGISTIIGDNHDDPILRRSALHDALAQDGNARHTIDNVARRRRNADMQNGSNHENWSYDDDADEEENFEASWSPGDHRQSAEIAMMFLMRWNNVDQSTVSNDNVASSEDQQKPDAVQQHTQQVVQDSNTNGDQVELFDTNLSYAVDGSIATGLSYSKNGDGDELS